MFRRRFKNFLARVCIALLFMQATVAAYACPIYTNAETAGSYAITDDASGAMSQGCDEQLRNIGSSKLCHQHYAGDLSGGTVNFAFAPPAADVPVMIVSTIKPVPAWDASVLPVLLHRATGPSLSIRFQVLRI